MKTSLWEERRDEAAISMENWLFSLVRSLTLSPLPNSRYHHRRILWTKKINKKSLEFEYYRNRTETRRANMCVTFNGNNKKKRKKRKKIPSFRFSLWRTQYHHRYVVCLTWSNGKSQQANALEIKNIFQLIIHFSLFSYIFFFECNSEHLAILLFKDFLYIFGKPMLLIGVIFLLWKLWNLFSLFQPHNNQQHIYPNESLCLIYFTNFTIIFPLLAQLLIREIVYYGKLTTEGREESIAMSERMVQLWLESMNHSVVVWTR